MSAWISTCVARWLFVFQAEDGMRELVRSRGLGDVYKRQDPPVRRRHPELLRLVAHVDRPELRLGDRHLRHPGAPAALAAQPEGDALDGRHACLLYTSDAADERSSVALGGRRIL